MWNTGETTSTVTTSAPGIYAVTVTDDNGCTGIAMVSNVQSVFDTIQVLDTTYIEIVDTSVFMVFDTIQVFDTTLVAVTDTLIINLQSVGVDDMEISGIVKVYPNPSSSFVIIDFKEFINFSGYELMITNAEGVLSYASDIDREILEINMDEIGPPGTYYIRIFDELNVLRAVKVLILM